MDEEALVSIITPTYNHEKFIAQCVDSVLAQTYPRWEQIIIDDGSKDKTGEIVSSYDDERIIYIRQENVGIWNLGKIYNNALNRSRGQLIAVLEGDDFWPAHKLERQINAFSKDEVVMSWGKALITNCKGEALIASPGNINPYMNQPRNQSLKQLLLQNPIPSSTVMCRKDALLTVGGFKQPPGVPYVDLPTWLELCRIGDSCVIDDILGCWRRHGRQVTSSMKAAVNEGRRYPLEFFKHLSDEEKESLGLTLEDLSTHLDRVFCELSYQSGRASLLEERWSEAEAEFKKALRKGCTSTRLKALAGLICSHCKTDIEWLTAITKEPRLRDLV